MVCERAARWPGAARGPPGTEGVLDMLITRGAVLAGGFFVSSRAGAVVVGAKGPGLSFLEEVMLALRPSEAKKPPLDLDVGVEGARERREEEGVPLVIEDERAGYMRWFAREG